MTNPEDTLRSARQFLADLCEVDTAEMTSQQLLNVATEHRDAAEAEGDALTAKLLNVWVQSLQGTPTVH